MTGFLAVVGPGADAVTLEWLHGSHAPDASRMRLVSRDESVALFSTDDLPSFTRGTVSILGDIPFSPADRPPQPLHHQRIAGLEQALEQYLLTARISDNVAAEHHALLWDSEHRKLFAVRDLLGVRPIFYAWSGRTLVVASAVRWVLAAGVGQEIDEPAVRRFVAGSVLDAQQTFSDGVRRLPPRSQLCWEDGELVVSASDSGFAWSPDAGDAGGAAAFRSRFDEAVAQRLAGSEETCCLLSGGLDSSAISVVGAKIKRLQGETAPSTLSMVFDQTPQWSERSYIESVAREAGLSTCLLEGAEVAPFEDFGVKLDEQGGLFFAPGLHLGRRMYQEAVRGGWSVVLDGHGGDEVVSYGWGRLHELASEGRWTSLGRELRQAEVPGSDPAWRLLLLYWLKYGPLRRWVGRVLRLRRRLIPRTRADPLGVALAVDLEPLQPTRAQEHPELPIEARQHLSVVSDPGQSMAMETLYAAASAVGVSVRFPFWDKELLTFCLSLPSEQKNRQGFARWILREAVPELPGLVRWRRDKLDFTPHLALSILRTHDEYIKDLLARPPSDRLWRYVHRDHARRLVNRFRRHRERATGREVQAIWRVTALALWLDQLDGRSAAVSQNRSPAAVAA